MNAALHALKQRSDRATENLQLPLGDGGSSPPFVSAVVEGETAPPHEQYQRLFGYLTPRQVMMPPVLSSPEAGGTDGSPPALCDPTRTASHPFFQLLADMGHPSAHALTSIALLRQRHIEKGFTPQQDATHGHAWFWHGVHEFWWKAVDAGSDRARRRKHQIAAAAMMIAMIDAEEFQAQQEATSER